MGETAGAYRRATGVALLALAGPLLTGCGGAFTQASTTLYSTVTKPAPRPSPSETPEGGAISPAGEKIRADGVFAVGDRFAGVFRDRVDGQIPAGRYRVEVSPDQSEGAWMRCSSLPCGPAYPKHSIVAAQLSRDYSELLDFNPNDVAVWLSNVTLLAVA